MVARPRRGSGPARRPVVDGGGWADQNWYCVCAYPPRTGRTLPRWLCPRGRDRTTLDTAGQRRPSGGQLLYEGPQLADASTFINAAAVWRVPADDRVALVPHLPALRVEPIQGLRPLGHLTQALLAGREIVVAR